MTAITWPLSLAPSSMTRILSTKTTIFANPYGASRQIIEWPTGQAWYFDMTFPPYDAATHAYLSALFAKMRGPANYILMPCFDQLGAFGSLAGNPQLASGSSRTLTVTGFTANSTKVLIAGDMIQTSTGRGHIVTDDVNSNGSGVGTVYIEPPLREAVTVGPLVTTNVSIKVRIVSDKDFSNRISPPILSEWSGKFVEDIN